MPGSTVTHRHPTKQLASVFTSGNSQAVRLPKAFRVDSAKVEILRRGDEIVLRPHHPTLANVLSKLTPLPQADVQVIEEFMTELRSQSLPEDTRDWSLFDAPAAQATDPKSRSSRCKTSQSRTP